MRRKKISFFSILLYILVFFPYLKITPYKTDTQPGALIVSIFIIFVYAIIKKWKLPWKLFPLLFVACFSVFILLLDGITEYGVRSVGGYISVPIITYATYIILKKDRGINNQTIKIIIIIWGIIGLVQTMFDPFFMTSIISNVRTNVGVRGVTGLAVEPTYYGQMMYFLLFYVLLFFENKWDKAIFLIICLLQIVFFAKSTMIVLILFTVLLIFIFDILIKKWDSQTIKYILFFIGLVSIGIIVLSMMPKSSRLVVSIHKIFQDGIISFFKNDASANDRLSAIYFSFRGSIENFLLPNGFKIWPKYQAVAKATSSFFWYGTTARIMCMYGAMLFELGVIGLIIIYVINSWLIKFIKVKKLGKYKFTLLAYINLIFMTAVPLATPFVGFLLGTLIYYNNKIEIKRALELN